jgi:hypothetical protein
MEGHPSAAKFSEKHTPRAPRSLMRSISFAASLGSQKGIKMFATIREGDVAFHSADV